MMTPSLQKFAHVSTCVFDDPSHSLFSDVTRFSPSSHKKKILSCIFDTRLSFSLFSLCSNYLYIHIYTCCPWIPPASRYIPSFFVHPNTDDEVKPLTEKKRKNCCSFQFQLSSYSYTHHHQTSKHIWYS